MKYVDHPMIDCWSWMKFVYHAMIDYWSWEWYVYHAMIDYWSLGWYVYHAMIGYWSWRWYVYHAMIGYWSWGWYVDHAMIGVLIMYDVLQNHVTMKVIVITSFGISQQFCFGISQQFWTRLGWLSVKVKSDSTTNYAAVNSYPNDWQCHSCLLYLGEA